jgi:hypothetical protein
MPRLLRGRQLEVPLCSADCGRSAETGSQEYGAYRQRSACAFASLQTLVTASLTGLTSYASGRALVQEAQELAKASPAMALDLLRLAGGEPAMITGLMVTQSAHEGDVAALRCFDVVGTWLGRWMAQLAAVLDPGLSVHGGGVFRCRRAAPRAGRAGAPTA